MHLCCVISYLGSILPFLFYLCSGSKWLYIYIISENDIILIREDLHTHTQKKSTIVSSTGWANSRLIGNQEISSTVSPPFWWTSFSSLTGATFRLLCRKRIQNRTRNTKSMTRTTNMTTLTAIKTFLTVLLVSASVTVRPSSFAIHKVFHACAVIRGEKDVLWHAFEPSV